MQAVLFYILAGTMIVASFLTISSRNILRAAVYLLFVLGATAGLYFMLNFNFLAAVQLMVYSGGIVVLIIFSILLTHQINTILEASSVSKKLITGGAVTMLASVFLWLVMSHKYEISTEKITDSSVNTLGLMLMNFGENGYVLPFEVISILLLAAMIGAIIIAKKFTHD